jgi:hypothetical protein
VSCAARVGLEALVQMQERRIDCSHVARTHSHCPVDEEGCEGGRWAASEVGQIHLSTGVDGHPQSMHAYEERAGKDEAL